MIYSFFTETLRFLNVSYMGEFISAMFNSFLPVLGTPDEGSISVGSLFISHCLSAVIIWLVGYVFLGIGLYAMARKRKMKIAPLAFVPFAATYLLGKLVGEINFFGKKIKRLGLYAMILQIVVLAARVLQDVFYLPVLVEYFPDIITSELFAELYGNAAAGTVGVLQINIKGLVLEYSIVALAFFQSLTYYILLLFLFRNYAPKSSFLFIVISLFANVFLGVSFLSSIFVFSIRNNSCEEYREYMRMKMHSMYGGGNPYQYDDGSYRDPYAYDDREKADAGKKQKTESPFSEYEDK